MIPLKMHRLIMAKAKFWVNRDSNLTGYSTTPSENRSSRFCRILERKEKGYVKHHVSVAAHMELHPLAQRGSVIDLDGQVLLDDQNLIGAG
jgi:hypothetical protein